MCVYRYMCVCHILFIHSSTNGHLDCFHVLVTLNSVVINIGVHVAFHIRVFLIYRPRSGILGSCGNSLLSFLRNFASSYVDNL